LADFPETAIAAMKMFPKAASCPMNGFPKATVVANFLQIFNTTVLAADSESPFIFISGFQKPFPGGTSSFDIIIDQ
jgi:hypothetical protein